MSNILSFKSVTAGVTRDIGRNLWSETKYNPDLMMCPVFNHQDGAGRSVGEYSYYTKNAGCNSALDRIGVENSQRPKYADRVTINAAGIGGYYGDSRHHERGRHHEREDYVPGSNLTKVSQMNADNRRNYAQSNTGQFGLVSAEKIRNASAAEALQGSLGRSHIINASQDMSQDMKARHSQVNRDTQNAFIGFTSSDRLRAQNYPQRMISPVKYSVDPNLNYGALSPRGYYYANEKDFKSCAM